MQMLYLGLPIENSRHLLVTRDYEPRSASMSVWESVRLERKSKMNFVQNK